jgi:hypothetical protein
MTGLKAIGIRMPVLVTILLILSIFSFPTTIIWDAGWLYAHGLAGIFVIGVIVALIVVYGNRYEVRFRVDNRGASHKTRRKTRERNAALIFGTDIGSLRRFTLACRVVHTHCKQAG